MLRSQALGRICSSNPQECISRSADQRRKTEENRDAPGRISSCSSKASGGEMRAPVGHLSGFSRAPCGPLLEVPRIVGCLRSEEHTSELQSLMRISYAVFCLKKKKTTA